MSRPQPLASAVLPLFLLVAGTAAAQEELYRLEDGSWPTRVDDVTGDGHADFLMLESQVLGQVIQLRSGVDGTLVRSHDVLNGVVAFAGFSGSGDFDGDGVPDYALDLLVFTQPTTRVLSGANGNTLLTLNPSSRVAFPGDLDGDGDCELALLDGGLQVLAGPDGALLYQVPGMVRWVSGCDDANGDGVRDMVAIVLPDHHPVLLSGKDGSEILRFPGAPAWFVDGQGDANADGVPDVLASNYSDGARLYSGADGSLLKQWSDSPYTRAIYAGDVDGDGHDDILVQDPDETMPLTGLNQLISGRTLRRLAVLADPDALTIGVGVARLGDLDGDGLEDFAQGDQPLRVLRGRDFHLDLWPRLSVTAGQTVRVTTRGGVPGSLALRFVVSVNDVPFVMLLDRAFFDAQGWIEQDLVVPSGLAGLDLELLSFTRDAQGKVIATAVQDLFLR